MSMFQGDDEQQVALFAAITRNPQHGLSFEKILLVITSIQRQHDAWIQFLNPDEIFGEEHLAMAFEKAEQNVKQGVNIADDLLLETLRIASGKRQIKEALAFLGVGDDCKHVLVLLSKKPLQSCSENSNITLKDIFQKLCCELGLREEPSLIQRVSMETYMDHGKAMGKAERESLKKKSIEQMAMIDL